MAAQRKPFENAEGSMSKLKASEVAVRACEQAIQTLGGWGYIKDFPVEKWYRDAKLYTIFEGTSEIQRLVIGRALRAGLGKARRNPGGSGRLVDDDAAAKRDLAGAVALSRQRGAEQLVEAATMGRAELENFVAPSLSQRHHRSAKLTVGVMALRVQERGRNLDFQVFIVVEEIDQRRGINRRIAHQFARCGG